MSPYVASVVAVAEGGVDDVKAGLLSILAVIIGIAAAIFLFKYFWRKAKGASR